MEKKILINNSNKVIEGFNLVADAVGSTLGAHGGLALITNPFQGASPIVTKDGITVAKHIHPKNRERALGASLAKEICAKSLQIAGDGTTTSLVLAQALMKNLLDKFNPDVAKGVEMACEDTLKELRELAQKTTEKDVKAIATIATNNDSGLGELLLKAYIDTGGAGTIDVEKNPDSRTTTVRSSNGMRLNKGFKSPYLATNIANLSYEASDVNILVYEGNISIDNIDKIGVFLNTKKADKEPILIICENVSDDVVNNIAEIKNRLTWPICIVEAPFYADQKKIILSDIALYSETEVFVQGVSKEYAFGKLSKVIIDSNSCTLMQDSVNEKVKSLVEDLKLQINLAEEKDFVQKRIDNLEGSACTILVGGDSDSEVKEKFDRIEDAVRAVRSSLTSGWVAGGGSALSFISGKIKSTSKNEDVLLGYEALKNALQSPLRKLCENSNVNCEEYLQAAKGKYGVGYNAATNKESNLIKDGVIDSLKSIETALINSKSVVNLLMNVKVVITD